jgi:addiction module HigA family antidote
VTRRHASIEPVHPGEVLREDVFPALKITKPALAAALGVSRQTLHELMACKRAVTPEMALRLEAGVGSSGEMWLGLQAEWRPPSERQSVDLSKVKRVASRIIEGAFLRATLASLSVTR